MLRVVRANRPAFLRVTNSWNHLPFTSINLLSLLLLLLLLLPLLLLPDARATYFSSVLKYIDTRARRAFLISWHGLSNDDGQKWSVICRPQHDGFETHSRRARNRRSAETCMVFPYDPGRFCYVVDGRLSTTSLQGSSLDMFKLAKQHPSCHTELLSRTHAVTQQ